MKKVFALILCISLFVAVIPASAFADVDLSGAYTAAERLNNACARLAAAIAGKNAYDTAVAYRSLFGEDSNAGFAALMESWWWAGVFGAGAPDKVAQVEALGTGMSYEALFELIAPDFCMTYTFVGDGIEQDVKEAREEIEQSILEAVAELIDSMTP